MCMCVCNKKSSNHIVHCFDFSCVLAMCFCLLVISCFPVECFSLTSHVVVAF